MSLLRRAREALEGGGAAALFALFAALPLDAASALGGRLAGLIGPATPLARRARASLALALPHLAEESVRAILAHMWDNLGRTLGEYPHLERLWRERERRIALVGEDILAGAALLGRPVFVFSGHLGNWEIMPVVGRRLGMRLTFVYRAPNNPWVRRLLDRARRRGSGAPAEAMVPKGPAGARQLLQALRAGGSVGMLMDQKMNDGIAAPFFGRLAMTAPALADLARRHDGLILPVRCQRLEGARFRVAAEPPWMPARTDDRNADVLATTTRINAILERWIRDDPGQWLWLHRRWPPGVT